MMYLRPLGETGWVEPEPLPNFKPRKTKTTQPETPSGRDLFQTPNYAVDLIIPYIPSYVKEVWEPAAGGGKIAHRLQEVKEEHGLTRFGVLSSDINPIGETYQHNFLTDDYSELFRRWYGFPETSKIEIGYYSVCIITNPPFSLKKKFYEKCISIGIPFALLIPADYSGWIIDAIKKCGCEKIIPTRRIDYITPSGLSGKTGHTADFHSMWLTWGFGLGKTETFVELTNKMKENI